MAPRRHPPGRVQADTLDAQGNRCLFAAVSVEHGDVAEHLARTRPAALRVRRYKAAARAAPRPVRQRPVDIVEALAESARSSHSKRARADAIEVDAWLAAHGESPT